MKTAAIFLLLAGVALFAVGWTLNMNTPMQNSLPVYGVALFVVGALILAARGIAG